MQTNDKIIEAELSENNLVELEHHKQLELCRNRPPYRQGRKLTAVKVYTINDESTYLLIFGVPKINLRSELKKMCRKYGEVSLVAATTEYPCEQFTECFKVKYGKLQSARVAKKMLDNKNYYGSVLHVCYAPELESVEETRNKLAFRKFHTMRKLQQIETQNQIEARNKIETQKQLVLIQNSDIPQIPSNPSTSEDKKVYVFKDKKRPKCDISALRKKTDGFLVPKSEIEGLLKINGREIKKPKVVKSPSTQTNTNNSIVFNIGNKNKSE